MAYDPFDNPISATVRIAPDSPLQHDYTDATEKKYWGQARKYATAVRGGGVTMPATSADFLKQSDPLPVGETEWYGVGGAKNIRTDKRVPETVLSSSQFSENHAMRHLLGVEEHNSVRAQRGAPPVFAGGWAEGGNAVMDHSTVHASEREAQGLLKSRGERAYFDALHMTSKDENGREV